MSEFFRQIAQRRADHGEGAGSPLRAGLGLVVVLGVLGLGLLVAAVLSRSVVGVVGAVVVAAAALCWRLSDRPQIADRGTLDESDDDPDGAGAQDYPANLAQARWALLSIALFLVGLATFGVGVLKGW